MRPNTFRVIEWPVIEPVSISEVKSQVGLMPDQTEHDQFLMDKVAAGRRVIETRLSMTLVATKYRATWMAASGTIKLLSPPLLIDADHPIVATLDGESLTAAAGDFTTDTDAIPGELKLAAKRSGRLVVEYWGGVAPGRPICPMLKSALLVYATHMFENRGIISADWTMELPQAFNALLAASSWNGGW